VFSAFDTIGMKKAQKNAQKSQKDHTINVCLYPFPHFWAQFDLQREAGKFI